MRKPKNSPPAPAAGDDLHSAVFAFIRRGQRAQAAAGRILADDPTRRRIPKPKGHA